MGASVFLRGIDSRHLKDGPDGTIVVEIGGADDFEFTDADHDVTGTACNLIVNGTIKLTDGAVTPTAAGGVYINLGDN